MTYTDKTEQYLNGLSVPDFRLEPIRLYAEEHGIPILRPASERLLTVFAQAAQPERILEVGTAIGYSGSVMLLAANRARLTTVEVDEMFYSAAQKNFARLALSSRVTQLLGSAAEILEGLEGEYGFIFLDGPKAQYVRLLPKLLRLLAPGGLLVADNVLYRGMVAGERPRATRMRTIVKRMREFLQAITATKELTTAVLPVEDGMSVSVRKREE